MIEMVATGAYGRKAVLKDWVDGKDFQVLRGPYFSIRDVALLKRDGYTHVKFINLSDRSTLATGAFMVDLNNPKEAL